MITKRLNFTEKVIASLAIPAKGVQELYYDTGQTGLCLLNSYGGSKTYFAYLKFQGRPQRTKIGRAGEIKLIDARAKVRELRALADKGVNPSKERNEMLKDMTLKRFFETVYVPKYSAINKKPKTQAKDKTVFMNNLVSLHNRKMLSVTRQDLDWLHNKLKSDVSEYTANRAIALLKHMYNKAIEWGFPKDHGNPAQGIKMFKEKARDRFLQPDELRRFFRALDEEPNTMFKNYILLSLYIGQRRSNMLRMRWSDINLELGFAVFLDTKNGDHRIPLVAQAKQLLASMPRYPGSDFVFPSDTSKSGHIEDFHRPWYALLKRAEIEDFRIHDIRRTFGSYQAIRGSSTLIIGKSLGDKTLAATLVYSQLTFDPVLDSMQNAANTVEAYGQSTGAEHDK